MRERESLKIVAQVIQSRKSEKKKKRGEKREKKVQNKFLKEGKRIPWRWHHGPICLCTFFCCRCSFNVYNTEYYTITTITKLYSKLKGIAVAWIPEESSFIKNTAFRKTILSDFIHPLFSTEVREKELKL